MGIERASTKKYVEPSNANNNKSLDDDNISQLSKAPPPLRKPHLIIDPPLIIPRPPVIHDQCTHTHKNSPPRTLLCI